MKLKKPTDTQTDDSAAKDFIAQADKKAESRVGESRPWEEVDPKKMKVFSFRIPMDSYEKLRYLADKLPRTSMNDICLDALEPHLEEILKDNLK